MKRGERNRGSEQSEARRALSEPRCEQSDERSESCECVSAPRSTTCCASCGKVCASGVVEHTTDDGDTREAAGKLLCATTLSSFDAAIVTRRRRRMTSFAFPSGGAPTGASLHLRRPLRRRRPGTEYADCTYGSDCADCGPPALPASSAHVRRDVQLGFRRRFRRRRRPRRRARHRLLPTGQTTPVARFGLHRSVGSLSWVRTPRCLGPTPPECLAHLTYTCFARSLSALFEQIPAEEALEASVRRGEARCRARIAAAP